MEPAKVVRRFIGCWITSAQAYAEMRHCQWVSEDPPLAEQGGSGEKLTSMMRWAFLDVGNILLDEDPLGYRCTQLHWEPFWASGRPDLSRVHRRPRSQGGVQGSRLAALRPGFRRSSMRPPAEVWKDAEPEIRGVLPVVSLDPWEAN